MIAILFELERMVFELEQFLERHKNSFFAVEVGVSGLQPEWKEAFMFGLVKVRVSMHVFVAI